MHDILPYQVRKRIDRLGEIGAKLTPDEIVDIDKEINVVIATIQRKDDVLSADKELTILADIQDVLALIYFKYKFEISPMQRHLVRVFDRYDDASERLKMFRAIKAGQFLEMRL